MHTVMSNRSNSTVRNLLAKFEGSNESTASPPSRGRSPSGSESLASIGSTPLSKIRTSFIAVERSGGLGPQLGLRRTSDKMSGEDTANGCDVADTNGHGHEPAMTNGTSDQSLFSKDSGEPLAEVKEEPATGGQEQGILEDQDEEGAITSAGSMDMLSGDFKGEDSVSMMGATPGKEKDLGSLLKGSPFEGRKPSQEPSSPPKVTKSPKAKVENGSVQASGNPATPSPAKANTASRKPSAISTSKTKASTSTTPPATAPAKTSPKTPRTPKTPTVPAKVLSASKQASPKTFSPKQQKPSGRLSVKHDTSKAQPEKRAPTTSKGPAAVSKPRPKSPTHPVRLPSSLTAPTAASAAKVGGVPPSRSPSRASAPVSNVARKPLARTTKASSVAPKSSTTSSTATRTKPSRTSLPSSVQTTEQPKTRGSNPKPAEGFLERMMRPTQSSSSKSHEKVELKTPPKKSAPFKPRRKSEEPKVRKVSQLPGANSSEKHETESQPFQEQDSIDASGVAGSGPNGSTVHS